MIPKLQPLDIVLFKNKSLLGFIIRKFIDVPYNHIGIIIGNQLIESVDGGVKSTILFDRLINENVYIRRYKHPSELNISFIENFAKDAVGKIKYDYKNLFFYQFVYRLTGLWIGKASTNAMICSEFVARCYSPYYKFGDNLEKISPKEIYTDTNFFTIYKEKFII
jgi:uncharacterized protein YycO